MSIKLELFSQKEKYIQGARKQIINLQLFYECIEKIHRWVEDDASTSERTLETQYLFRKHVRKLVLWSFERKE